MLLRHSSLLHHVLTVHEWLHISLPLDDLHLNNLMALVNNIELEDGQR